MGLAVDAAAGVGRLKHSTTGRIISVQSKGGFMQEAGKPGIAYALDVIGWIVLVLSILAAVGVAIATTSTVEGATPMLWAATLGGAASGLLLLAFATVIQQLHRIAGLLDKFAKLQPMPESAAVQSEVSARGR